MKGIYKGFKYTLSQIFVLKEEREMEIGYPTDVKHLAHIGWDGPSGACAPSWMNEFKTQPDFGAPSFGNSFSGPSPLSSQDLSESMRHPTTDSKMLKDTAMLSELPSIKKKQKRSKSKSTSSYGSTSSFWPPKLTKPKSSFMKATAA